MMDSKFKLERLVVCTSHAMFLPLLCQPVCLFAWCCWSFLGKENPFSQLSPSVVQTACRAPPHNLNAWVLSFPTFVVALGLPQTCHRLKKHWS
jgi:hypothetical protein